MSHFRTHLEYLKKRGKRGEAVHDKVERYEAATGAGREDYSPPPLMLAVLIHLACAGVAHHLRTLAPLAAAGVPTASFEITQWFTMSVIALHAFWALAVTAVAIQARSIWKKRAPKQVANENKAD